LFNTAVFLVPSVPLTLKRCDETDSETSLCISWIKPNGGNAIDNYTVEWSTQNSTEDSKIVLHNSSDTFSHTIEKLSAGERVNVTVSARNSAGDGGSTVLYSASSNYLIFFQLLIF